jgi:hypothetical protein
MTTPWASSKRLDGRLLHLHRLEAPLEGCVLLEVFLVFRPGGGRDGAELSTRQRRFKEVRRVAAALSAARADEGMRLVDEEDDGLGRRLHLGDDALEAVLELALHASASLESTHVQREHVHVLQLLGDVALGDGQRQPLDQRRLADAGLPHDDGVVLPAPHQDIDQAPDLRLAAEDRVEAILAGALGEVRGETGQRALGRAEPGGRSLRGLAACGRRTRGPRRPFPDGADRSGLAAPGGDGRQVLSQIVALDLLQHRQLERQIAARRHGQAHHERAGAHLGLAQLGGGIHPRVLEQLEEQRAEGRLAGIAAAQIPQITLDGGAHVGGVDLVVLEDAMDIALQIVEQGHHHVLHGHLVVAGGDARARGPFEGTRARGVQRLQQGAWFCDKHRDLDSRLRVCVRTAPGSLPSNAGRQNVQRVGA